MKNQKTKIEFEYEDKDYVLEYTADSLKKMEKQGFNFQKLEENVINAPSDLFCGLFIAHHNNVPVAKRLEIFKELCDADESGNDLLTTMADMIAEAINELMSHKGNITWKAIK